MIRSFKAGGKMYSVTSWNCKYDGREGCSCCEPKNTLHPAVIRRPGIREFVFPFERPKSISYTFSNRSSYDGAAKSKRKR